MKCYSPRKDQKQGTSRTHCRTSVQMRESLLQDRWPANSKYRDIPPASGSLYCTSWTHSPSHRRLPRLMIEQSAGAITALSRPKLQKKSPIKASTDMPPSPAVQNAQVLSLWLPAHSPRYAIHHSPTLSMQFRLEQCWQACTQLQPDQGQTTWKFGRYARLASKGPAGVLQASRDETGA